MHFAKHFARHQVAAAKALCLPAIILSLFVFTDIFASPAETYSEGDYFSMSLQELCNIEVTTATRRADSVSDIPASVVVITREEIEMFGYSTIMEILQNTPGLYLINDYAYEGAFGVRGFWDDTSNKNLVIMVNGVRQVSPAQGANPMTKTPVPVEAIDRIEVIRGPMYVMYGTGAFFGAINIITNEAADSVSTGQIVARAGSNGVRKIFGRASGRSAAFGKFRPRACRGELVACPSALPGFF